MDYNGSQEYQQFEFGFVSLELQTPLKNCECKKADEQILENRIEIDLSEAKKYEFTHESCVFFISFFPT